MRILFLTHFFPPEVGAPQTRILETAKNLRDLGHEVAVLTTFPNYPDGVIPAGYRGKVLMREEIEGIPVVRSWLYAAPNRGFGRRIFNHGSFAVTAAPAALRLPWRPDVMAVDMHPIFLCGTALFLSRVWRVPYVINAGDLIPDQAVAFGALTNPLAIRLTRGLANLVCRRAAMIVPLTRGIGRSLAERGVAENRLEVIYYGANTAIFDQPDTWLPLPDWLQQRLEGCFVVTYAGTHGLGQGLDIVVSAAEMLREQPGIHFLLVGGGSEKQHLVDRAAELKLENISFVDPLPHLMMPSIYQRSDACLVSLRRLDFLKHAGLPSKLFEIMAAGRPAIVAAEGEPVEVIAHAQAGVAVTPECPQELAEAVARLRDDPELRGRLGENGRRYIEANLTREQQTRRYEAVLRRAIDGPAGRDDTQRPRTKANPGPGWLRDVNAGASTDPSQVDGW